MAFIDESLPLDRKLAEAVLFVRSVIRRELTSGQADAADLALLFGLTAGVGRELGLGRALETGDPESHAAEIIAAAPVNKSGESVPLLGQAAGAAELCRRWLLRRHLAVPEFANTIVALDLMTLIALEQTRVWVGSGLPLLVEGPTGTGKELVARAAHESARVQGAIKRDVYEVVHVAGMTADHISDELFGHVRGAFTGADRDRVGRIEAADGGTLLIDEVGDLPPEAQLHLLRVLQEREVSRRGDNLRRKVNVQIIANTQHDLPALVVEKKFREDLLQRLRGYHVRLPRLTERYERFDELVAELVRRLGGNSTRPTTTSAMEALRGYAWPGNLRELETTLRSALHLAAKRTIRIDNLPTAVQQAYLAQPLAVRALGLLADETDEAPLTRGNAELRVRRLEDELSGLPIEQPASVVDVEMKLLEGIPDNSESHAAKKAALQELRVSTAEAVRTRRDVEVWTDLVVRTHAHPVVGPAVDAGHARAVAHDELAQKRAKIARDRNTDVASGWSRIFAEISQMPFFADANGAHIITVANFIRFGANVTYLLAPQTADDIRDAAVATGFLGVRKRIARLMSEGPPAKLDASAMNHEDWADFTKKYSLSSLREAAAQSGVNSRTITKYLGLYRIRSPWKKK